MKHFQKMNRKETMNSEVKRQQLFEFCHLRDMKIKLVFRVTLNILHLLIAIVLSFHRSKLVLCLRAIMTIRFEVFQSASAQLISALATITAMPSCVVKIIPFYVAPLEITLELIYKDTQTKQKRNSVSEKSSQSVRAAFNLVSQNQKTRACSKPATQITVDARATNSTVRSTTISTRQTTQPSTGLK